MGKPAATPDSHCGLIGCTWGLIELRFIPLQHGGLRQTAPCQSRHIAHVIKTRDTVIDDAFQPPLSEVCLGVVVARLFHGGG